MNKRLTIAKAALFLSVPLFFMQGCSEDPLAGDVEDPVCLSLRLDEVFQEKAYVRLTHDGDIADCWYYMCTADLETDARLLIEAELAAVLETDGYVTGNVGANKNVTLEGLEPKTAYRMIAARISPAAAVMGDVAELCFVTLRDPDVFELYPSWRIDYKERRVTEEPYAENDVFACEVAAGDTMNTYIPCLLAKEDFTGAYGGSLRRCFEDYVGYLNLGNVKWEQEVRRHSGEFVQDRLRHGDYLLFMIGVDSGGRLTGYYSETECTIRQETPVDEYRAWIGKWTLSGEYEGTTVSYDIEIAPEENNLYYRMYGWEGISAADYFKTVPEELPVQLYFYRPTGCVYVVSEKMADLSDPTLADFYDFYLYGFVEVDSSVIAVDIENLSIARFEMTGRDYASVIPETFTFDYGGSVYERPFMYFCYCYTSYLYAGLTPVTTDAKVPGLSSMRLERK